MRIGIIGAGATGLTAAYELGKRGHDVVVYERAAFLGDRRPRSTLAALRWNAAIITCSPEIPTSLI